MAKEFFNSLEDLIIKYPKKELGKAKDLSKDKFNRLQPITRVDKPSANSGANWACRCDCGKYIVALGSQIISGHTSSCGCYNKEITKKICQELGKKSSSKDYSKIENPFYTFIKPLEKKDASNNRYWEIACKKCGTHYEERPSQLISYSRNRGNNPCSCWQSLSKGILKICDILEKNNIPYQKEYSFKDCLSPLGNLMKFDFFIKNGKYLIEYDGEQHFIPQSFGDIGIIAEEKLKKQKEYDEIKNQYCLKNDIPLIRIPYTRYNQLNLKDLLLETTIFKQKDEGGNI